MHLKFNLKYSNTQKNKMKKISIILLLAYSISYAGIYRHDVKEEEYLKLAKENQFDGVGQVFTDTNSRGSCVLINERYVLSAAHVFFDNDNRKDTMKFGESTVVIYVPINVRQTETNKLNVIINGKKSKVKNLTIHPNYIDSISKGTCDFAILELDEPITNTTFTKINNEFNELNSNVVGVGFGASGPADSAQLVASYKKKIAGENVVDSIGGFKYLGNKTLLYCDFDHPSKTKYNKMGSSIPRPLEYVCSGGDSGGALFSFKKNEWQLLGICSGNETDLDQFQETGYYGEIMSWTRVSAFYNWIQENTK